MHQKIDKMQSEASRIRREKSYEMSEEIETP